MKRILFLVYLLSHYIYSYAELSVTLNVETPGSLSSMIASSRKSEITHLTITGKINGSDIKYIREMADSYKKTSLAYLDISGAQIVKGGTYYTKTYHFESYQRDCGEQYTEDNTITPYMFCDCGWLKTLLLPNSVTKIAENAFFDCSLESITLPENLETFDCVIPSFYLKAINISENNDYFKVIDGVLYSYDMKTLYRCPNNFASSIFSIPEGVENIYKSAFFSCSNIKEFRIPSTLKSFGYQALAWLNLDKFEMNPNIHYSSIGSFTTIDEVIIPSGYSSFDPSVFGSSDYYSANRYGAYVNNVKIYCITPPSLKGSFNQGTLRGNLYVPKGSYSDYYIAYRWGDFSHIYEMESDDNENKCAKPTITYSNGKLSFLCETEGVSFNSTITNSDISSYRSNEIQLGVTYIINVYATKTGYESSDVVTATLSWIDVEPKTEGISNDIALVQAKAILIQSQNGQISIEGVDDDTRIYAYEVNGQQVGSAISHNGQAKLTTNLKSGSIVIIKVGDRNVKATIK